MHVRFIRTVMGVITNTVSSYVDCRSHRIVFCPCPVLTPIANLYTAARLYF